MLRNIAYVFGILALVAVLGSCKDKNKNDNNSPGFNQGELLRNWGNNIIVPAYTEFDNNVTSLNTAIQALNDNPSDSDIQTVGAAYSNAYLSWQKVSFLEFGPAADQVLRANVNTYPCDTSGLEVKLKAGDYDLSAASDLTKKGLPAIDYLLYGPLGTKTADRVAYLKVVSADLAKVTSAVAISWYSTGGDFVSVFNSNTGNSVGTSMGIVINALNQHLERYHREGKIGIPNGERSFSGTPLPGNVEATYEEVNSTTYAIENLRSIERMYLGKDSGGNDGKGLDDNLRSIGANYNGSSLDAAIQAQFAKCYEAYGQVTDPLNQAVVSQNERVSSVYKEIQKLVVLFKADMPSALGVLITYQDNDGD